MSLYSKIRSTKGIKRLTPEERKLIIVPSTLQDILIGILLVDGHIAQRSVTGNSRFHYGQSSIHKEYFIHVYSLFHPIFFVTGYTYSVDSRLDKRSGKYHEVLSFVTMQLPCFNYFRNLFYINGVKTIPNNIYELLNPAGLAFWIMDDGSRQNDGVHLSVYAFSTECVDKLMFTLQDKFSLKCTIHYNRDNKPRIYIFKESMPTLIKLVHPYFHPSMLYKIGM